MKKMLFVFDLHGTLYTDKYIILPETKNALKLLYKKGHIIAISSGQHYTRSAYLLKSLEIGFIVIGNTGALIKDFKLNKVYQYGFVREYICEEMFKLFREFPSVLYIHDKNENRVIANNLSDQEIDKLPMAIKKEDYCTLEYAREMVKKTVTQISIKAEYKYIQDIYKKAAAFNTIKPYHRLDNIMNVFVDFGPPNSNKWTGVLNVAKQHGIDENDIYCFGDNQNDYEMIKNCVNSVAMGNALDDIKELANYQTDTNNENGIYNFLNKKVLWKMKLPNGLYGITSNEFPQYKSNFESAKALIDLGVKVIQYREKNLSYSKRLIEAKKIKEICFTNKVIFIVNDDLKLAVEVDADGFHTSIPDLAKYENYLKVRSIIGKDKIIGLSVYDLSDYEFAMNTDCNYIGVGSINKTKTKSEAKVICKDLLNKIAKESDRDIVAIGGIKLDNISNIFKLGIFKYAIISEVLNSSDIPKLIKRYNESMKLYIRT